MVKLFTTYYREADEIRRSELELCLLKNIRSSVFDKVYILSEADQLPFVDSRVTMIKVSTRPTFQKIVDTLNSLVSDEDIVVVSNTDIYFDRSLQQARDIRVNELWALTRYDVVNESQIQLYISYKSSDAWIFKGKCRIKQADFYFGQLGCDNRFAALAYEYGYNIRNPCLTVVSYHVHGSAVRGIFADTSRRSEVNVGGTYVYVIPTYNGSLFTFVFTFGLSKTIKRLLALRVLLFKYLYQVRKGLLTQREMVLNRPRPRWLMYLILHDYVWSSFEELVDLHEVKGA
jgi:hypothetical protein